MSFFETFFRALDGPDPVSALDHVAESCEYAIFWTADAGSAAEQHVGGKEDLRRFVEAGGVRTWAHHLKRSSTVDGVEMVVGETRLADGQRVATFVAAAELDDEGRMTRYMVARTPALGFVEA